MEGNVEDSYYEEFISYLNFLKKGRGSKVWDYEGNVYIDFDMCRGNAEVGYGNPLLVNEVINYDDLERPEAERLIKERYHVEKVRFLFSEIDAITYAVNIARRLTKRSKIVQFKGNGAITTSNAILLEWNDISTLERVKKIDDIAAFLFEPIAMNMGIIHPEKEFLSAIFEAAKDVGALVIFDETKTGGKTYSGASEVVSFEPDIKILGRQIAGNFPIGIIAGKKDIVRTTESYKLAIPISVKALEVTLKRILTKNSMYSMIRLNEKLTKGYKDIIEDLNLEATLTSLGISTSIYFSKSPPRNYPELLKVNVKKWRFYHDLMLEKGIIPAMDYDEEWTVSAAHKEGDIQRHIEVAYKVLKEVNKKVK